MIDFFNKIYDTKAQSESELEGEAPSDNKPSGSMERDDTLLKQSELELKAGEPSAKNMWRSGLSSMPSVPIIEITPFTQHSTSKCDMYRLASDILL